MGLSSGRGQLLEGRGRPSRVWAGRFRHPGTQPQGTTVPRLSKSAPVADAAPKTPLAPARPPRHSAPARCPSAGPPLCLKPIRTPGPRPRAAPAALAAGPAAIPRALSRHGAGWPCRPGGLGGCHADGAGGRAPHDRRGLRRPRRRLHRPLLRHADRASAWCWRWRAPGACMPSTGWASGWSPTCAPTCSGTWPPWAPPSTRRTHSGEVMSRLTADTTQIKGAAGSALSQALRNLIMLRRCARP